MRYQDAQKIIGFCNGERPKGDFYATPSIAITKLLDIEKFGNTVLEPCCGNGAISKILENLGYTVTSRDLYDWNYGTSGIDFLKSPIEDFDAVITNPPFNLSIQFAIQALEFTKKNIGKVAMLNRIQWLEGIKRKSLFKSTPISKIYIFSKRLPRFNRYDYTGKQGTSLLGFAWYIWDWTHIGPPILDWI